MEKTKKNNGTLVGILIGLVIAIIIVGGLFLTNKINFITNTKSNDVKESSKNNESDITKVENTAKELGEKMYLNLYSFQTSYVFCGENMIWNNEKDYISDPSIGDWYHKYDVSQDFKSMSELNEYLKSYMTEDMIKKYYQIYNGAYEDKDKKFVSEVYIEKDGKLYCLNPNKDHGFVIYDKENSTYNIINRSDNSIMVTATIGYKAKGDETTLNTDKIQYEVIKENNSWVIKSFLNIPSGMINIRNIETYLNEIIEYNELNPQHKITIAYEGNDYSDKDNILSIVNKLDSWQISPNGEKWKVFSVIYNEAGYISKLVII